MRDDTEMVRADEVTLLERSLQNSSIDIESDDEEAINSLFTKNAKCSTPLSKVPGN